MKLYKHQCLKMHGTSYLAFELTPFEKKWFTSSPTFLTILENAKKDSIRYYEPPTFLIDDPLEKDKDLIYIRIQKYSEKTDAELQQILKKLIHDQIISINEANELLESVGAVLNRPISYFINKDNFVTLSTQPESLTQIAVGEMKVHPRFMTMQAKQRQQVEDWIKPYFIEFDKLEPLTAIKVLSEIDENDYYKASKFKKNPAIYPLIQQIQPIFDSEHADKIIGLSGISNHYDCIDYIHFLLNKKLLQISLDAKIIDSLFAKKTKSEPIIDLMNLLVKSKSFLKGSLIHDLIKYSNSHAEAFSYFLVKLKLSPNQALKEIIDLNYEQLTCLLKLYAKGMRGDHLRTFDPIKTKNVYFTYHHTHALDYFINEKQYSPAKAMAEINGLTAEQVDCLKELSALGLRGEHLRNWRANRAVFDTPQAKVLKFLIEHQMKPARAIHEINELTGLRCQTLEALYVRGLRGDDLRNMPNFGKAQMDALISLVEDQKVPLAEALEEIKLLKDESWFIESLEKLYSFGLRSQHLLAYESTSNYENNFTCAHSDAIISLIKDHHLSPPEAISEISKLTGDAASVVRQFYSLGLRGSDLRNWEKHTGRSFDADYHFSLILLVKENGMSINQALDKLKEMSSSDVYHLASQYRYTPEPNYEHSSLRP